MRNTIITALVIGVLALTPLSAMAQLPDFATTQAKALKGDAEAQYELGFMYVNAQGVTKNDAEAFKWFKLAADQGVSQAQYYLMYIYFSGQGVTPDYAEGYKWLSLAARQNEQYSRMISQVEKTMTPKQIAEGKARVAAFVPKVSAQ